MNDDLKSKLLAFHGNEHVEGSWNSKLVPCCDLCKTKSTEGKRSHWARGLCRSCYRRLSPNHRIYNDNWNSKHSSGSETKKQEPKKDYKTKEPYSFEFDPTDIKTLLVRYDFKCCYCRTPLQDYDPPAMNAFQIEYKFNDKEVSLIPICRGCNCSKKNISEPAKLARWAKERGIDYPFTFIPYKLD